jgi:hypothetical protein
MLLAKSSEKLKCLMRKIPVMQAEGKTKACQGIMRPKIIQYLKKKILNLNKISGNSGG